jgi:hypothetical protein
LTGNLFVPVDVAVYRMLGFFHFEKRGAIFIKKRKRNLPA